jgi:multidrug efflux pump subunit AcrA (membrane-fusion protein)
MPENNYDIATEVNKSINGHSFHPQQTASRYELRSEEVNDIISKMPHWIIRQGTLVLFIVMAMLFAGAYFVRYPDVIVTSVNITSTNPPVKIVAQTSGRIKKFFVQNNQQVKKEELICLLENAADYGNVQLVKSIVKKLDTSLDLQQELSKIPIGQYYRLGELQSAYTDLYQSISQYLFFVEKNFASSKLGQIQAQISYQSQLNQELQNRDQLLKQQLSLERKKFIADSSLVVDKVIAPLEFDNSKKELINKQILADATRASILENKLQQAEYMKTITELKQQKLQQENELEQRIRENVKRLQGQIEIWEQQYVIKSPEDGNISFFKFWKENQYINSGEAMVMIVPPLQHYIARSALPVYGAGKVKTGQKVLIKLSSFPFQEFGMIKGSVESVSSVALDTAYSMQIKLSHGLLTTTNKNIPAQPQFSGIAEVITNDKNVLERLFEKITVNN